MVAEHTQHSPGTTGAKLLVAKNRAPVGTIGGAPGGPAGMAAGAQGGQAIGQGIGRWMA